MTDAIRNPDDLSESSFARFINAAMAQFLVSARWPVLQNDLLKNTSSIIPPVAQRMRVGGAAAAHDQDGSAFLRAGHRDLGAYKKIYEVYSGKDLKPLIFWIGVAGVEEFFAICLLKCSLTRMVPTLIG